MIYTHGVVFPRQFRGYYPSSFENLDLIRKAGYSFGAVILNEGLTKENDMLKVIVEKAHKASLMLIGIWDFDAPAYFETYPDPSGWKITELGKALKNDVYFKQLLALLENKTLYALILRLHNSKMKNGGNLPPKNMNIVVNRTIQRARDYSDTVYPHKIGETDVFLSITTDIAVDYPILATRLSQEPVIAREDVKFRDTYYLPKAEVADEIYANLPKIGIDGEEHDEVDKCNAGAWNFDWWTSEDGGFQTKAYELDLTQGGYGDGVVGGIVFNGSQQELFDEFGFEDKFVPPVDPPEPPEPPDPPDDDTESRFVRAWKTFKEALSLMVTAIKILVGLA